LKIVIQNLLLNAAHAMQGQGHIRVTVTSFDSRCRIDIADSGPGIPPHVREKLFTPVFHDEVSRHRTRTVDGQALSGGA
jgi:signal transduction histidine kinase